MVSTTILTTGCGNSTGKASGDGPAILDTKLITNLSSSNSTYGYNLAINNVVSGFNSQQGANDSINAMVFDNTNNKLIIGGNFTKYNGVDVAHIARLNTDGTLDTSFAGQLTCNVFSLTISGSLLLAGCMHEAQSFHNNNDTFNVVKGIIPMNLDGSLNTAMYNNFNFNNSGIDAASSNRIENIFPSSFGYILLGRFSQWGTTSKNNIVAINSNGSINTSNLQTASIGNSIESVKAIDKINTNNYLVGGNFTTVSGVPKNYLASISPTGAIDNAFPASGLNITGPVHNITKLSTNKLIIGLSSYSVTSSNNGSLVTPGTVTTNYKGILALNPDGSLDTTFNSNTSSSTKFISGERVTTIYNEGTSLLVGGIFSKYNDTTRYYFARIGINGNLNTSCDTGNLFSDGEIKSIAKDANGSIYLGGSFYIFNSSNKTIRSNIIKLGSNCALDLGCTGPNCNFVN